MGTGKKINLEKWKALDLLNKAEIIKKGKEKKLSGSQEAASEGISITTPLSCNRLQRTVIDPQEKRQHILKKGLIQLGRNRLKLESQNKMSEFRH